MGDKEHEIMAVESHIQRYWGMRARHYDRAQFRSGRGEKDQKLWREILREHLNSEPQFPFRPPILQSASPVQTRTAQALDLGCGSGFLTTIVDQLGYEVTGIDMSKEMIQIASQRYPHLSFHRGDASHPSVRKESQHLITNRYLLWTLPDPLHALSSWYEILRPGGCVLIIDAPWFPQGIEANLTPGFREHYTQEVRECLPLAENFSPEKVCSLLEESGFKAVSVTALEEIYERDLLLGAAPGHEAVLQYLFCAYKPA